MRDVAYSRILSACKTRHAPPFTLLDIRTASVEGGSPSIAWQHLKYMFADHNPLCTLCSLPATDNRCSMRIDLQTIAHDEPVAMKRPELNSHYPGYTGGASA